MINNYNLKRKKLHTYLITVNLLFVQNILFEYFLLCYYLRQCLSGQLVNIYKFTQIDNPKTLRENM